MFFRNGMFLTVIAVVVLTAQGCETLKGAGKGFKKDTENIGVNIKETDAWITENLW